VQFHPSGYKLSATTRDKTVARTLNVPKKGRHTEHMGW